MMKHRWAAFLLTICVLLAGCTSSKESSDNQNATFSNEQDSSNVIEEEVDAQGTSAAGAGESAGDDPSLETQQTGTEEAGAKENSPEQEDPSEHHVSENAATEDKMPMMPFEENEKDQEESPPDTEASSSAKMPDQTDATSMESDGLGPGRTEPNEETESEDCTEASESDCTETSETETSVKPIELPFVPVQ